MDRSEKPEFELKALSREGIAAALEKAERYRLLNEAREAESICLDVLETDPDNDPALVMLLLSVTDQFEEDLSTEVRKARELLPRLRDEYERTYYEGLILERQAKATLKRHSPLNRSQAYEGFREAMELFEKAEALRPPGNDDAILRWNTCARLITRYRLEPRHEESEVHLLE